MFARSVQESQIAKLHTHTLAQAGKHQYVFLFFVVVENPLVAETGLCQLHHGRLFAERLGPGAMAMELESQALVGS